MIDRNDYLNSIELVHHDLLVVLSKWMANERENLLSFLNNPTGHVLYNPLVIPDTAALTLRAAQLQAVVSALGTIIDYKNGLATKTQCDVALDMIPAVLFKRLLDWMEPRYDSYNKLASSANVGAPISEYGDLVTFNLEAFMAQVTMYKDSIDGVKVIIEYKNQQVSPPVDPEPEPPIEPEEPLPE